ncbi:hypothetical protein RI367_006922 [Sorochytrium milnesiophthora]
MPSRRAHSVFWDSISAQCGDQVSAYDRCIAKGSENCAPEKLRRDECLAAKLPAFRQAVTECLPQFELFHQCMTAYQQTPTSTRDAALAGKTGAAVDYTLCSRRARDLAHCMRVHHPKDQFVNDMADGFERVDFSKLPR